MFSIGFTDEPLEHPYDDVTIPAASGFLILGESREDFLANLSKWSKVDYERHWNRELRSLLDGRSKVALIVSYDDPQAAYNMEIWKAYMDSEVVRFQNQLPWYDSLPSDLDPLRISEYIDDRAQGGSGISEWTVPLTDVLSFMMKATEKQS
jgi:hypothetical protein